MFNTCFHSWIVIWFSSLCSSICIAYLYAMRNAYKTYMCYQLSTNCGKRILQYDIDMTDILIYQDVDQRFYLQMGRRRAARFCKVSLSWCSGKSPAAHCWAMPLGGDDFRVGKKAPGGLGDLSSNTRKIMKAAFKSRLQSELDYCWSLNIFQEIPCFGLCTSHVELRVKSQFWCT